MTIRWTRRGQRSAKCEVTTTELKLGEAVSLGSRCLSSQEQNLRTGPEKRWMIMWRREMEEK